MSDATLLQSFDLLATAPGGAARLRELILTLAVQGKLVPQNPKDEPASGLLKKIRAEKDRLIAAGKLKRDKPLAEIAEDEKPFELPTGWEFCRLGELLLSIRSGGTPSKQNADFWNGDIPWASVKDLRFGDPITETQDRITRAGLDAGSELAPAGSILICTRMGLGKIGEALIDVAINQDLKAVQLGVGVSKQYFINYFKTLNLVGSGMTVAGVKQDELLGLVVPMPPDSEQTRIVDRVEELMKLCDALEEKGRLADEQHTRLISTLFDALINSESAHALAENWKLVAEHFDLLLDRPEVVDALEQTILQLAVRGLLVPQDPSDDPASELLKKISAERGGLVAERKVKRDKPLPLIADGEKPFTLPASWEWVRLGTVSENRLGKMLDKAKNTGQLVPYLRNTNVQWRHFDLDDIKEIKLESTELDEFRLRSGDLLICEGGEPGRCAIWRDDGTEMYFQKALHRVRMLGGASPELVAICLEADAHSGGLDGLFTGATIKHFVGKALESYLIPLPPLAEQARIVARVESLRLLCADLRKRLALSQATQSRLAEALVSEVS